MQMTRPDITVENALAELPKGAGLIAEVKWINLFRDKRVISFTKGGTRLDDDRINVDNAIALLTGRDVTPDGVVCYCDKSLVHAERMGHEVDYKIVQSVVSDVCKQLDYDIYLGSIQSLKEDDAVYFF